MPALMDSLWKMTLVMLIQLKEGERPAEAEMATEREGQHETKEGEKERERELREREREREMPLCICMCGLFYQPTTKKQHLSPLFLFSFWRRGQGVGGGST